MVQLGGPLGITLAPYILKNPGLHRIVKPIANAFVNAAGYRKQGLRYDDLSACPWSCGEGFYSFSDIFSYRGTRGCPTGMFLPSNEVSTVGLIEPIGPLSTAGEGGI